MATWAALEPKVKITTIVPTIRVIQAETKEETTADDAETRNPDPS